MKVNVVFQGTQEECNRWVAETKKMRFTYQVVPVIETMYAVLVEYIDHRWWEIFDTETEAENYAADKYKEANVISAIVFSNY